MAVFQAVGERDEELVQALGILLAKTEKREEVVSNITGKLEEELVMLAKFLNMVASRRPKGKRYIKYIIYLFLFF